jgi:hypothetical protein
MAQLLLLLGLLLPFPIAAQSNGTSTLSYAHPSGYTSSTFNNSAQPTAYTRTDFSPNALASLWDIIGPIATGPITSTVSPTPEPTLYPQPDNTTTPSSAAPILKPPASNFPRTSNGASAPLRIKLRVQPKTKAKGRRSGIYLLTAYQTT